MVASDYLASQIRVARDHNTMSVIEEVVLGRMAGELGSKRLDAGDSTDFNNAI